MNSDNPYASTNGYAQEPSYAVAAPAAAAPVTDFKDVTTASFAADVLAASRQQPVLVDFWAPWCGPCKQLAPYLEKAVSESGGRVTLVKMNIDDHPTIPGQLGIQSIPAVIAFKNGKPVDGFMGAQPEGKIVEFINRVAGPDESELQFAQYLKTAQEKLGAGEVEAALEIFSVLLEQDPDNQEAAIGLASCLVDLQDLAAAKEIAEKISEEAKKLPTFNALQAKITLAEQVALLGDPREFEERLAADPKDHQARYDLAMVENARGNRDAAADHLLHIIRADRTWNEDGARKQLLQLFDAWGPADPASLSARRKLSSALFS
jgi:putative thioredoxin